MDLTTLRQVDASDLKISTPFRWLSISPSGAGKSVLCRRFISQSQSLLRKGPFSKIFYCTRVHQSELDSFEKKNLIEVLYNVPSEQEFIDLITPYKGQKDNKGDYITSGSLFVFDDMFHDFSDKTSKLIFQVYSRHMNCSIISMQHTIFSKNPLLREISLNCTIMTLHSNARDKLQSKTFFRQITDGKSAWLEELYRDLSKVPFSYLFIDFSPTCKQHLRFRSHILEDEGFTRVYCEKQK